MARGRTLRRAAVTSSIVVAALLGFGSASAGAVPPEGAGSNSPGTSSSVSPRELEAGQQINFTVSGFPPGETVNIKIDDGLNCSQASVFGACVVHKQRVNSSGTASGSFTLPADVGTGPHWLRFLASAPIKDAAGNQIGVDPFTNRGDSDFTVVEPYTAPAPAPETTPAPPTTQALPTTQAPPTTEAPPATTEAPPVSSEAPTTAAATPTTSPTGSASVALTPLSADAVDDDGGGGGGVVIIGIAAVVAAAAVGSGIIVLRNRKGGPTGGATQP